MKNTPYAQGPFRPTFREVAVVLLIVTMFAVLWIASGNDGSSNCSPSTVHCSLPTTEAL